MHPFPLAAVLDLGTRACNRQPHVYVCVYEREVAAAGGGQKTPRKEILRLRYSVRYRSLARGASAAKNAASRVVGVLESKPAAAQKVAHYMGAFRNHE
jgi:hypothetical protein